MEKLEPLYRSPSRLQIAEENAVLATFELVMFHKLAAGLMPKPDFRDYYTYKYDKKWYAFKHARNAGHTGSFDFDLVASADTIRGLRRIVYQVESANIVANWVGTD